MTPRNNRIAAVAAIATAIAIPAEGLRQFAYYDPPGILTVCYGHTGDDVQKRKMYSLDECRALLTVDMLDAVEAVERCHPNLPVNVHAAFADAVYNIGPRVACDSTASKYLAAGQIEKACKELPRWNKSSVAGVLVPLPGLTKRRNAEMMLCLSGL
jgi:GH24 family phage-related lysozyme (muramidase)